jgi:predicted RND superfamily exporter protein
LTAGHWSRIGGFESAFIIDLKHHIDLLKDGLHPEKVSISDLPESIMRRYISPMSKRISVYAYPKDDIWDPAKMSAFIKDIRSVDPTVTGTPVEVYESSRLMEKSFRQAAIIALIAIVVIVLLDFKNWRLSLLSIMPLALGVFWLLELMGLFGIKFNLANFFGIPMLLGIGVDNAVQIVHRYVRERRIEKVSSFMLRATGLAVLLTSLTTLASFGTMIFARHQGIASLGLIMTLGTLTCFIGSMIVLPCVLIIIERSR